MTPEAAAEFLAVPPRTLIGWARLGIVPHVILRHCSNGRPAVVRFKLDALERWLGEHERGNGRGDGPEAA